MKKNGNQMAEERRIFTDLSFTYLPPYFPFSWIVSSSIFPSLRKPSH
jgi:hypothetical protein